MNPTYSRIHVHDFWNRRISSLLSSLNLLSSSGIPEMSHHVISPFYLSILSVTSDNANEMEWSSRNCKQNTGIRHDSVPSRTIMVISGNVSRFTDETFCCDASSHMSTPSKKLHRNATTAHALLEGVGCPKAIICYFHVL